jgi:hypothetical protein
MVVAGKLVIMIEGDVQTIYNSKGDIVKVGDLGLKTGTNKQCCDN